MVDEYGLTRKQRIFADELLETGNGTQSALKAYDTDDYMTAAAIASENLNKPKIIEYLDSNAEKVAANMVRLALGAEKESDQIAAGRDVLDRAGYKPVVKTDINNPDGNLKTIIINKAMAVKPDYESGD